MIIVIDALNRHLFKDMLSDMHALRQQVLGPQSGTAETVDTFDQLNPAYVVHLGPKGQITGSLRLLQTTGPHMLSDSLSEILAGEAPLRSARLWEASQVFVDLNAPEAARITATLMTSALEYARRAGVLDMVVLLNPQMDQMLSHFQDRPSDYLGLSNAGIVAALMDCSPERIAALRSNADLPEQSFASSDEALALYGRGRTRALPRTAQGGNRAALRSWCEEQILAAQTPEDRAAAEALRIELSHLIDGVHVRRCKA
ncbi:acyl-homoserine-lactone synthase [Thalassobius sp. S69A]|uniref:acyl-homoserine-lactone synthase n=1 Tax=unclassified Thalassovita TaxID=2619711 RepID=UPI000C64A861|nr:autoinducer synthase [Paracoccaceae bacterium]